MNTKELAEFFGVSRANIYRSLRDNGHFWTLKPYDHPAGHGKVWSYSEAKAVKEQLEEAAR